MSKPPKTLSNREGYDQWSMFYDHYSNPTVAIDEAHFPPFWRHVSQKKVLEIGCGTGRHTIKLAQQNNTVVGIDLSKGMLDVARQRLAGKNVALIEADFLTYDECEKNSFDAVVVSLVIEHIQDLDLFFKKVAQILKANGTCFIYEIHPQKAKEGTLAHFKNSEGNEINLTSFVHSDHTLKDAASAAGLRVTEEADILGDKDLGALNSKWARHLNTPMIKIWVFKNSLLQKN